jgi:hypothetical protein
VKRVTRYEYDAVRGHVVTEHHSWVGPDGTERGYASVLCCFLTSAGWRIEDDGIGMPAYLYFNVTP